MASYHVAGDIVYHCLPINSTHSFNYLYNNTIFPPSTARAMKRRLDESADHTSVCHYEADEDDFYVSKSKRFLSEEMMSAHMQNLHLTTPPHQTLFPDTHNAVNEFDWSEGVHDNDIVLPDYEEDPVATPSELKDMAPPTNNTREDTVTMEENSEDSSDDDSNPSSAHMWIAPEMKSLLDSNKSLNQTPLLLPDRILEDMNKPCQALVPVMESSVLLHSVWNDKNTQNEDKSLQTSTSSTSSTSSSSSCNTQLPSSSSTPVDYQVVNHDRVFQWIPSDYYHENNPCDYGNHGDGDVTGNHGDHKDYNDTIIVCDDIMEL